MCEMVPRWNACSEHVGNREGTIAVDQPLDAAKRRFPVRGAAIEHLADRSEDFRSLCIDLSDAEAAALKWEGSTSPKRDERVTEYIELAGDLAKEIEAALDAAAIIPFGNRRAERP